MIKNFEEWREVIVLNFLNLVLKRYWKSRENDFFLCGNPVTCNAQARNNFKLSFQLITIGMLTLLEPPGFGDFHKKNSSFRLPYQHPSSSVDYARELFSGSNASASLVDCNQKKFFCLGVVGFFCEWRHK